MTCANFQNDVVTPKSVMGKQIFGTFEFEMSLYHIVRGPCMYEITIEPYNEINISRIKSQKLNLSRLALELPLPKLLKPGVKSRMKM